jgi:hypothetical protein
MRDERGVVVSWIIKLLLGLAVFGAILFDAGSITTNYFGLQTTADEIAATMSTIERSGEAFNQRILEEGAAALAEEANAKLVSAEIDSQGIIRIRLKRKAGTLIVGNVGPIKSWGRATAGGQASTDH